MLTSWKKSVTQNLNPTLGSSPSATAGSPLDLVFEIQSKNCQKYHMLLQGILTKCDFWAFEEVALVKFCINQIFS